MMRSTCVVHMLIAAAEEHDVVIIGGGVAGYVAAIKAGQEGLKVNMSDRFVTWLILILRRLPA